DAFADVGDGASRKPPELRRRRVGIATLRLPGHELSQPEAQLSAFLGRKLRDGLLDIFQGHQRRIAVGTCRLKTRPNVSRSASARLPSPSRYLSSRSSRASCSTCQSATPLSTSTYLSQGWQT